MKLVFAPDSFKGTLSSDEVIELLTQAARECFDSPEICAVPIADGGEGTVRALVRAAGGRLRRAAVTAPDGAKVEAVYGMCGTTAVIEMASSSGLTLIKGEMDPLSATSRGTGELIAAALADGCSDILIGIGGSGTNDGGMGAMRALGIRFLDGDGRELSGCGRDLAQVCSIDCSGLSPAARTARIRVLCDVNNPLLGENGATRVYGPQKGAVGPIGDELESGMEHYARVVEQALGKDFSSVPGTGAAGGMGFALIAFLQAQVHSGIETVLEAVGFDRLLEGADLVVTGEGRIDSQSARYGKVVSGVAQYAAAHRVPMAVLAGSMADGCEAVLETGLVSIMTNVCRVEPLDSALSNARELTLLAARRMFRFIRMGLEIGRRCDSKRPEALQGVLP